MLDEISAKTTIDPPAETDAEAIMVARERWEEIRRLFCNERLSITEIARRLQIDRKTVRRCVRQEQWLPYQRAPRQETLLTGTCGFSAGACRSGSVLGSDSLPGAQTPPQTIAAATRR